jgi:glycosyltransferase involved in cell wall biosynthesis
MRIAHITATFPPYYGGTGSVCYHNALELARRGHEVHVYTAEPSQKGYVYPTDINVHQLPPLIRFGNAPLLPRLLKIDGFDVLHLHYPFFFGAELSNLVSKRRKIPLVITYHQDVLLKGLKGLISTVYDKLIGLWVLQSAEKILFTTLDYGKHAKVNWLFREYPERISSLPNGVDINRFHPSLNGTPIRDRYKISQEKTVLLLVAGLDKAHYFKGVDILLNALKLANQDSIHLIIIGDGDLRPAYQQRAAALNIDHHVTFAGRVSDEELPMYYAASDIGVLPSTTMGEAFGVVLLEAMACGKPVIASNLPGVRSVFQDGQQGLFVTPGDANDLQQKISYLINQPELQKIMGANGRRWVEDRYAWPKIADQLEVVYGDVIARKPGA